MSDYKLGYEIGLALGCATHGVSPAHLRKQAAKAYTCEHDLTFQKALAGIAETIFIKAGSEFKKEAAIYAQVGKSEQPLTKYATATFITPVLESLAEASRQDALVKEAGWFTDIIGAGSAAVNGTQEALYKLALLGLIGGGTTGVIANMVSRHMREDNAEAEAKKDQARHYRRIAKDLQKRIDATTSKSDFKKKVEDEEESDYVL